MKKLLIILALFTAFAAQAERMNSVLIVSIDALHPAAVTAENAPNIMTLAGKGVISLNGRSTNPPKTLISHSAMFTGLTPETGGKADNLWQKGEQTVPQKTIFNTAKDAGYNTAFIYSKGKLGFLSNSAVDHEEFSREYATDSTIEYVNTHDNTFVFLHISGLDNTGPEYGWLSKEYIEDFRFIDEELKPLFDLVQKKGKYLIIITSDHAGHAKEHGTDNPEDFKLPFIAVSDSADVRSDMIKNYETYMLGSYLKKTGIYQK